MRPSVDSTALHVAEPTAEDTVRVWLPSYHGCVDSVFLPLTRSSVATPLREVRTVEGQREWRSEKDNSLILSYDATEEYPRNAVVDAIGQPVRDRDFYRYLEIIDSSRLSIYWVATAESKWLVSISPLLYGGSGHSNEVMVAIAYDVRRDTSHTFSTLSDDPRLLSDYDGDGVTDFIVISDSEAVTELGYTSYSQVQIYRLGADFRYIDSTRRLRCD